MRRLHRPALDSATFDFLAERAARVETTAGRPDFDIDGIWSAARKAVGMKPVVSALRGMTGRRERCMYCLDSHGTDIEHFWPKAPYPERAFSWPNMLLCCAECGRHKLSQFPLYAAGAPLLIDPSAEQPWEYLDFDPETGNLTARFDRLADEFIPKGKETVRVLHLDRREEITEPRIEGWRRLSMLAAAYLNDPTTDLARDLWEADKYGLLDWGILGAGSVEEPFCRLKSQFPGIWAQLHARLIDG